MNDESVVPCLPEITDHVEKIFIILFCGVARLAGGVGESRSDVRSAAEQVVEHA